MVTRRVKVILALGMLLACAAWGAAAEVAPEEVGVVAPRVPGLVPETLSLEQAIAIALDYNPGVAAAEQGVWASRGQLTQALSALQPRLDVVAQRSTPVNLPPFSFQNRGTTYSTNFSLSQALYTAGSLQKGAAAAREALRGAEGSYQRARQQTAFAVRQAYYAVLTSEEGVKVAAEVVSSAQEHLRVARLHYEAGVAPQYDVLAAEARVARVEQELISARAGRDTAWANLGTVLGVSIPQGTRLTTPPAVAMGEASLEELTREALEGRPDLKVATAGTAAARAQVLIAKAARQPTISAAISYTLIPKVVIPGEQLGAPPGTELVVAQNSGDVAFTASWSLFNGGQLTGQIRTAEARMREAQQAVDGLKLQIGLEVKSAYLALEAARAQLLAAQKEAEQAQEAHRIATLRYEEGVGTSVEILDAEANLEGARTRLNQARFGLNLAVALLDLAVGRGFYGAVPATPTGSKMSAAAEEPRK
jgi:outer membrane protein TolC